MRTLKQNGVSVSLSVCLSVAGTICQPRVGPDMSRCVVLYVDDMIQFSEEPCGAHFICSWCTFNRDVAPRVTSAGRTVKRCGRWPTPGERSPPPVVTVRLLIAGDTRLAGSLHWAYRQLIASDNAHFEVGFYSFGATSFISQAFCFLPHAVCGLLADSVSISVYNGAQRLCNVPRTHIAECSRQPQRAKERKCCFCGAGESCKLLKLDSRKLLVADSEGACYQEQLEEKLKRRRENATLWSEPFLALSPVLKAVNSPQCQICASHTHRCSRDYFKTVSVSLCKWNIYIYIYFVFPS